MLTGNWKKMSRRRVLLCDVIKNSKHTEYNCWPRRQFLFFWTTGPAPRIQTAAGFISLIKRVPDIIDAAFIKGAGITIGACAVNFRKLIFKQENPTHSIDDEFRRPRPSTSSGPGHSTVLRRHRCPIRYQVDLIRHDAPAPTDAFGATNGRFSRLAGIATKSAQLAPDQRGSW